MAIQRSSEERTAAMRSTSNRLLRIKQASASSILQAVSRACGHGRERERGSVTERRHRKEGVVMLLKERTKEKKQDNRTTNKPMCLSSPQHLWMR